MPGAGSKKIPYPDPTDPDSFEVIQAGEVTVRYSEPKFKEEDIQACHDILLQSFLVRLRQFKRRMPFPLGYTATFIRADCESTNANDLISAIMKGMSSDTQAAIGRKVADASMLLNMPRPGRAQSKQFGVNFARVVKKDGRFEGYVGSGTASTEIGWRIIKATSTHYARPKLHCSTDALLAACLHLLLLMTRTPPWWTHLSGPDRICAASRCYIGVGTVEERPRDMSTSTIFCKEDLSPNRLPRLIPIGRPTGESIAATGPERCVHNGALGASPCHHDN